MKKHELQRKSKLTFLSIAMAESQSKQLFTGYNFSFINEKLGSQLEKRQIQPSRRTVSQRTF